MGSCMADPFHRALSDGTLDALGAAVAALDAPDRYDRNDPLLPEAVALLDGLLVRVARGRGGLDVEIGARLAALAVGSACCGSGSRGWATTRVSASGSRPDRVSDGAPRHAVLQPGSAGTVLEA